MPTSAVMRGILMLGTGVLAAPAALAQTEPPRPITIDGSAVVTSDYRLRGVSLSDRDPAVQLDLTLAHRSGAYAGLWASSIASQVARGADIDIDLTAGYRRDLGGTTLDVGVFYDAHPGGLGAAGDVVEPYLTLGHTLGPVSGKIGVEATWKQSSLGYAGRARSDAYGFGELSTAIPTTPLTLTARLGHSFVRNYRTFGERYTDWSLTAAYVWRRLTFSLGYVDTDRAIDTAPTRGGSDREIGGAGVVGSIAFTF